jgi:hypothetical protein
LLPIPSRFNHSIKDWRCRQMWLFVLCQEHSTDTKKAFCALAAWSTVVLGSIWVRRSNPSGIKANIVDVEKQSSQYHRIIRSKIRGFETRWRKSRS